MTPQEMYDHLIETVKGYNPAAGFDQIHAAYEYAAATMEGAAKLMLTAGQHPGQLKDAVCSPGGSTIQGVRVLEEKGLRAAAMDCVIAAFEKSRKLGG